MPSSKVKLFQESLVKQDHHGRGNILNQLVDSNLRLMEQTPTDLALDELGTTLIPPEFEGRPARDGIALKSTGDGNCLFNAVSLLLYGKESNSTALRLLAAEELYNNAEFYAKHSVFEKSAKLLPGTPEKLLFSITLSTDGDRALSEGKSRAECVQLEALAGCANAVWGSLFHVMALAAVIKRPIYSLYPDVNYRYRPLMQNLFHPRQSDDINREPLYLLWSREGNLDNRPNVWYQPNHIVPVVFKTSQSTIRPEPKLTPQHKLESAPVSSPVLVSHKTESVKKLGSIMSFFSVSQSNGKQSSQVTDTGKRKTQNSEDEQKMKKTKRTFQPQSDGKQSSQVPDFGKRKTQNSEDEQKKAKRKRSFQPHWQKEFPWVVYYEDEGIMKCSMCCAFPHLSLKTEFVTGCQTFKKETLQKHSVAGGHLRARDAKLAKQNPDSCRIAQSLAKGNQALMEQTRKEVGTKINTAYFIAKEELPFTKFAPVLDLQKKNGLDINLTYANDKSCANLVSVIASVFKEELANEVNSKKYISVIIDGATDASGKENETVHCRFVKDGKPANRIVGHKAVAHATAQGITEALNEAFEEGDIKDWRERLVGFGADGASVNLGKKGGVSAILRNDVPHLIDFHCLPHRLELALLEMQRSCRLVETVYNVLQLIWKTYHFSPKSTRELQGIAKELGVNVLKPTQVSGTRWIPHISRALKVFIRSTDSSGQYGAVLCHMEHLSSTSKNPDIQGRAKFVAEKMRSIQFVAFCHFLADMFSIIEKLSLKLQLNELILPVAVSSLRETIAKVELLQIRPVANGHLSRFMRMLESGNATEELQFEGHILRGSIDGTAKRGSVKPRDFQSLQNEAVSLCLEGLQKRFGMYLDDKLPDTATDRSEYRAADVVKDMLVFNVDVWPTGTKELINFGNAHIDRLTGWFRPAMENANCKVDEVQEEWVSMKVLVNTGFRDKDYADLWMTFLTKSPYKSDFENLLHLVEIMLVLPISAAGCERAISCQNRVKSSLRVSLGASSLHELISISAQGPPVSAFDPIPAVNKWLTRDREAGERQRRPVFSRGDVASPSTSCTIVKKK